MFKRFVFDLVQRLVGRPWMTHTEEHHGTWARACCASFGPLRFFFYDSLLVDHTYTHIDLRIPFCSRRFGRWRRTWLRIGYRVSRGVYKARESGWTVENY